MLFKTLVIFSIVFSLTGAQAAILYQDDFSSNSIANYTISTRGTTDGPAQWSVTNGNMVQSSNVYDAQSTTLWLGTIASFGDTGWQDIRLSVDIMSSDDDGIGVILRFIDSTNYYQFRWDRQRSFCRLEKMTAGAQAVEELDNANTIQYTQNTWYHLEVLCADSMLEVVISQGDLPSPVRLFGVDGTHKKGSCGLYSWGCQSANFDNILVTDAEPDTVPPAAITDLSASPGAGNGRINITWTAPGDDSLTGMAALYQIRYSLSPISDLTDFHNSDTALPVPDPDSSGSLQGFTLTNLEIGKTYYIRMRTADDFYNWSGLSNQVSAVPFYDPSTKNWYKGQIHCHTTNSDGSRSVAEVVALYKGAGYDFLLITDHNQVTNTASYTTSDFLTLPGNELTYSSRHVNAINISGGNPSGPSATLQEVINLALNADAIPQINHPDYSNHTASTILNTSGAPLMEIIQHFDNLSYNEGVWDGVLSTGRQIFGTGTDDAHNYTSDFNTGWIMVYANSLDTGEILTAIRNGDFYSSNGATISKIELQDRTLRVESDDGIRINFIGKDGTLLLSADSSAASYSLPAGEPYVRAKVANASGKVALTQAFFPDSVPVISKPSSLEDNTVQILKSHPNPFYPATNITYNVLGKKGQPVRLEIYDLAGKKIKTLVRSLQFPGMYCKTWNGMTNEGKKTGPGVYFYILSLGDLKFKRLILKLR